MKSAMLSVLAVAALAGSALGVNEVEINNNKISGALNNNVNAPADTTIGQGIGLLTGVSTGSNTDITNSGPDSRDIWRVNPAAQGDSGIYLNRLRISANSSQFSPALLGKQGGGDPVVQVGMSDANGKYNQWYSFSNSDQASHRGAAFYRIDGSPAPVSAGTAPGSYSVNYNVSKVTPVNIPGTYPAGGFSLRGLGADNTEMFLYDSSFQLIGQNDDIVTSPTDMTSRIVTTLGAGRYYVAISGAPAAITDIAASESTYTTLPGAFQDDSPFAGGEATTDFEGGLIASHRVLAPNGVWLQIGLLDQGFAQQTTGGFNSGPLAGGEVGWYTFEVVPTPSSAGVMGLGLLAAARRRRA